MVKAEKIIIFIDKDCFSKGYRKKAGVKTKMIPIEFWDNFNQNLLDRYTALKMNQQVANKAKESEKLHVGTWVFVSERTDFTVPGKLSDKEKKEELEFLDHMGKVDCLHGFVVKYGTRFKVRDKMVTKGVDINIVCQMLTGAFHDLYDVALLVSDNEEFTPAVRMVQDQFGKQVYHVGFECERLQAICYGNMGWE